MKKHRIIVAAATGLSLTACTAGVGDGQLGRVAVGAGVGAAAGAGIGAVTGADVLTSAAVGAAVGGLAGAVWVDRNGDGRTDGYVQNGRYYPGVPNP